ncbi:MAG: tyrosine-type recombinase/integrase [Cognatishimia sp.]
MVDRAGWLNFTQKKTGGGVSIPFHRTLPDIASSEDHVHLMKAIETHPRQMTFLVTHYGSSRSEKAASQWFAKAARNAGIKGKTAHGLRKTRAISIAERGGTTHQIAAWTGHESLSEVESYSKAAQKKRILSGVESEQKLSRTNGL